MHTYATIEEERAYFFRLYDTGRIDYPTMAGRIRALNAALERLDAEREEPRPDDQKPPTG